MGVMDRKLTIIDFETTGLHGENDRVVEIAAMRVFGGKITAEFSTLVKVPFDVPEKTTELTGIKTEDLTEALDDETAFRILNRFIQDSVIVAHNAAFDMWFLHGGLMRNAGRSFENDFIDTLTICRGLFPYPHTLGDMAKRFNITLDGAHRALNDTRACFELLNFIHEHHPVDEFLNILGYKAKYGPPKFCPYYTKLIKQ